MCCSNTLTCSSSLQGRWKNSIEVYYGRGENLQISQPRICPISIQSVSCMCTMKCCFADKDVFTNLTDIMYRTGDTTYVGSHYHHISVITDISVTLVRCLLFLLLLPLKTLSHYVNYHKLIRT